MEITIFAYFACYPIASLGMVGMTFAYWDAKFPDPAWQEHMSFCVPFSVLMCVFWPVSLPLVFCLAQFGRHGWRLTPRRAQTEK